MEFNSSNDIIFDNIVEQIKNKKNHYYECEILEENIDHDNHIKFILLSVDREKSKSFVINENNEILKGKKIKFYVNSLKIKIISNRPYFLIQQYEVVNEKNEIKSSNQLLFDLKSNRYKIVTSNKDIKADYLYTLILRAKEFKIKTQKYSFKLEDSNENEVIIDQLENCDLEHRKIYCFHGYTYNSVTLKMEPTNISYMEEVSSSIFRMFNSKEILEAKNNSLLNFKGMVKSFNITNKSINIENENKQIYKINANYYLIRQISLTVECNFFNFIKISDKEFIFSNLSFIEGKEKTFINFNFPFYGTEKDYYNKININNKQYDINNKNVKINIEDKEKNNLFFQRITYERVIEEKLVDSYSFELELDKGKIYNLISSTEKNGFSYEFYIQSINEFDLPKYLTVEFNNGKMKINNPDKNENKLKERFTIVNFPKQDIKDIFGLSDDNNKFEGNNNFKYLILIDNNKKKALKLFKKSDQFESKKDFFIPEKLEIALEKASLQCAINFNENYKDKLYNIDKNDINKLSEAVYDLFNGFQYYKFENSKRHYKIVKDIVSFSLNYFELIILGKYYSYRKNYEILLDSMINLEYIDRIKILVSFMVKIMRSIDDKKIYYDMFHLVDIDDENSYEKFPFVKSAFDVFYKILDNLSEDCPFFQAIHQFNSLIYKDFISGKELHSGSILNLNDIKLELVKNINRFIFLSEKSFNLCDEHANFEPSGLIVTFNMFSFSKEEEDNILIAENFTKASSAILFLLFHECLGHQKKKINNEKTNTPEKHYKSNFQYFSNEKIDTGLALEIILIGKVVDIKYFMNSKNSEKLLDPKLYTGKDFKELQRIYSLIENDNINKQNVSDVNKVDSNNKINKDIIQSEVKNIYKNKDHLMYPELFQLYSGISNEEKEKLKDDEDYQKFLSIYGRRHKTTSEYLNKNNFPPIRFGQKK